MSPDLRGLTVILCVKIEFIFASLKKICSNVINAGLYTFKNAALAYAKCQDIIALTWLVVDKCFALSFPH
jgi:hypothetical protein